MAESIAQTVNPEEEPVPKQRYARILVLAESDHLTANGEETEESGWDEVATNLAAHLQGFNKYQNATEPFARFIEWEEAPKQEEE